jgi:hypothetical protein
VSEIRLIPEYRQERRVVFPVWNHGYTIETLAGESADVERIEFVYRGVRGEVIELETITLSTLASGSVEYVQTIRMHTPDSYRVTTGHRWLDMLTNEVHLIVTDDENAW